MNEEFSGRYRRDPRYVVGVDVASDLVTIVYGFHCPCGVMLAGSNIEAFDALRFDHALVCAEALS